MKNVRMGMMFLSIFVLSLVLTACGGAGSNQTDDGEIVNENEQNTNTGDEPNGGITNLRLATTNVGSTGYMYAMAIATMANNMYDDLKVDVYTPGSAIDVIRALADGSAEIALGASAPYNDAYRGIGIFEEEEPFEDMRAMWRGYLPLMQIIVGEDSEINEIADLKGKRLATGEPGSIGAVMLLDIMETVGLTGNDYRALPMTLQDGANALKDGNVDVLVAAYGPGAPAIEELASSRDVKWLEIGDDVFTKATEKYEVGYYTQGELAAGSYPGLNENILTYGPGVAWVTRSDISSDAIYNVTKAFFENLKDARKIHPIVEETVPEESGKDFGIPMHPGAAKYFDEVGWEHDPAK